MITYRTPVLAEWIDYNGHLRDAYYLLLFSRATDALMAHIGLDEAGRAATRHTLYTLEAHINYLGESTLGDEVEVRTWFIDRDSKRLHLLHGLQRRGEGELLAASEQMLMNIDTRIGRGRSFAPAVAQRIDALWREYPTPARPAYCGQVIGIRR